MSGYQLYYFPIRGRAEMARWAFAAAKIDFEDVRLSGEEWAKEKACKYKKLESISEFHSKSLLKFYGSWSEHSSLVHVT